MVATPIKITTVGFSLAMVAAVETAIWLAARLTHLPPLALLGAGRILQIAGMLAIVIVREGGTAVVGAAPGAWSAGLGRGIRWSAGFALLAAMGMGVLFLMGRNPLPLIRTPLPYDTRSLLLFLAVGGVIAPLAEELCFRGILYTYLRRWGIVAALAISTTIFVLLHSVPGFPIIQIVGGVVFALAYESTGNLLVPIVIHISGNLAIFALSLAA